MKTNNTVKCIITLFGAALLMQPSNEVYASTITADFTGGNGNTQVDQYTGISGSGWNTAWSTFKEGGVGATVFDIGGTVLDTNPLGSGNPNRLQVSYALNSAVAQGAPHAGVRRQFDTSVIDTSAAYTVSFLFRVDELSETFDSSGDVIRFRAGNDMVGGNNNNTIWQLDWNASYGWRAWNGNGAGQTAAQNLTGISQTVGVGYSITIDVRPEDNRWDLTITNLSDSLDTITVTDLGYRTNGISGNYLGFMALANTEGDFATFSIDNLHISQVPEASTLVGVFLFAAGGLAVGRRRVKKVS